MKRKIVLAVLTAMFVVLIVTGLNGAASQGDELEDCTTINVEKTVWGDIEKTQWSNDQWSEHIQVPNGATVIFNITVENLGPCIIFDVYVNDTLPDGFVYQTGTAIVNGIPCEPTLSENGLLWFFPGWFVNDYIWYIEFNATANGKSCETYVNQVDVTAYQDPDHVLDPCIDDDSASVLIEGMCAKKQVSKNGQEWYDELNVLIGDTIRFRIEITFYGDYNLSNINVTDYLPECLEYTDNAVPEEPEISEDGRTLWWNLSDELKNGETLVVEFDAYVSCSTCQSEINLATVAADETYIDPSGQIVVVNSFIDEDIATINIEFPLAADAGGPYFGLVNTDIEIEGSAVGGYPPYNYYWDLDYDGEYDDASGKEVSYSWSSLGIYTIGLKVVDDDANEATDISVVTIYAKPSAPIISGPANGDVGKSYDYEFVSTDPDGDDVQYLIDWGDGETEWTSFVASGTPVIVSHTWSEKGTFTIKAKAKDINGLESDWGAMEVTMPRNKLLISYTFLQRILERFPNAFPILRQLLKL